MELEGRNGHGGIEKLLSILNFHELQGKKEF